MKLKIIKNCKFYRKDTLINKEDILIDKEKIIKTGTDLSTGNEEIIDAQGHLITPGFIDLQVNGGSNVFFNNNIDIDSLNSIYNAHCKNGTRFILITLITADLNTILNAFEVVKKAMENNPGILGLHLEGPFLSKEKPGAHNPEMIRKPTDKELDLLLKEGNGTLKKITIAPEVFTSKQLKKIINSGIIVSAGHSNATYEQAVDFFNQGVNCVTHLYNAMSPFKSKAPGIVGAAFNSDVFAGIIVDGLHSHFSAVNIAYKLKKDKLFLISDASFTGITEQDNLYLEGIKVSIKNGRIFTKEGSLAGASITISDAVKNCAKELEISKAEIIKMATEIPARLLGLQNSLGSIATGNSSKLNLLDEDLNLAGMINR